MGKFSYIVTFAVGALAGSAVAWHYAKKQYEEIIQREIDSVKEAFHRNYNTDCDEPECTPVESKEEEKDPVMEEYKQTAQQYNTINGKKVYYEDIYIITPDEFGEETNNSIRSLTYFSDGILADDSGEIINIDDTIGHEALTAFGEYEEDSVHVRNNRLCIDFEVLLDSHKYSEVYNEQS